MHEAVTVERRLSKSERSYALLRLVLSQLGGLGVAGIMAWYGTSLLEVSSSAQIQLSDNAPAFGV